MISQDFEYCLPGKTTGDARYYNSDGMLVRIIEAGLEVWPQPEPEPTPTEKPAAKKTSSKPFYLPFVKHRRR